jgi:hypothetical protein
MAGNVPASAPTDSQKLAGDKALGDTLDNLMLVVENYPELKANTIFWNFKKTLS